jgi:hypothetical protein
MQKKIYYTLLSLLVTGIGVAQDFSPYFRLGNVNDDIQNVSNQLDFKIKEAGYEILGTYAPGNQSDLKVLVFTNETTKALCANTASQGLIAATYRIGMEKTESGVAITTVNPMYQWRAYLTEDFDDQASAFDDLYSKYESFCKNLGNGKLEPFGGSQDADDLEDYHYMFGMPYYDDQVSLNEFGSYGEAVSSIEKKLKTTAGVSHVYTLKNDQKQSAIYGIGLVDGEIGESHFLSIIGQSHVAALPYELIVDGNEVKMLHGRFRFALYWPELTMGTFTKIMSTPGDVESIMKKLVE